MKNQKILSFLFIYLSLNNLLFGQESTASGNTFIDYSTCNFTIEDVKVVDKLKSKRKTIKRHDRDYCLVIVILHGKSPKDGILVFNPTIFSIISKKNGESYVSSSRGVGSNYVSKSGEEKEYWAFSEKNAIVISQISLKADEEFRLNVVFDLPEKSENFYVQIPALIKQGKVNIPVN